MDDLLIARLLEGVGIARGPLVERLAGVVGHSYIVYGPLLHGATTLLLFEGKPVGTPDAGAFWRVIR